ncbi:ABC transporter ATP-binding protein [Agromyces silvae]|uniref:ABC transporter ATP-binding protein n=1 Tax=Agromyces silvae TaxID=3388266 RepID=UPI00280A85F3|nr:ABC transporter ATP-binding protein [Agromyces protaetiae]
MTRILLTDVNKSYGAAAGHAVSDVNIDIGSGEFFTLLGPSGCGKTTTLRMVAGFVRPSGGTIHFDDDDVTHRSVHRRGTGMVFQNYALFPHLTVAENVAYGLKVRRTAAPERRRRIDEAIEQVHLQGLGARRISDLSGGQQQRVALARALVVRPRVLLLDEPLSNLDAKLRDETRREIRRVQSASGTTAIYVTHDQAEAMAMSDRIAVMEAGRVHQVAAPRELYAHPATAFVARFIGDSNVLDGRLLTGVGKQRRVAIAGRDGEAVELDVTLPFEPEGDGVALAVRREHVSIHPAGTPETLRGTVLDAEFTGMTTHVTVDIGSGVVTAVMFDDVELPRIDSEVGIGFVAGRVRGVRA